MHSLMPVYLGLRFLQTIAIIKISMCPSCTTVVGLFSSCSMASSLLHLILSSLLFIFDIFGPEEVADSYIVDVSQYHCMLNTLISPHRRSYAPKRRRSNQICIEFSFIFFFLSVANKNASFELVALITHLVNMVHNFPTLDPFNTLDMPPHWKLGSSSGFFPHRDKR